MKTFRQTVHLMRIVLLAILAIYAGAALILDHLPNPVFKPSSGAIARAEMTKNSFATAASPAR